MPRSRIPHQFLRKRFGTGIYRALQHLAQEWRAYRLHRDGQRSSAAYRHRTDLKLHIGCGTNIKSGFVNVDLTATADLTLDLREPLPFTDGSCALIYSEHVIEHVPYPDDILALLGECLRVLKPGGIFSAGVPDTGPMLLEYAGLTRSGLFAIAKERWHPKWCETEMEQINFHFRQGDEHKFAYDEITLLHILAKAGFKDARRRCFDPQLDQASWEAGTLYVEARKPLKA